MTEANHQQQDSSSNRKKWWKPLVFIGIILLLFIIVRLYGLESYLQELQPWIQEQGLWAAVVFFCIYLVVVIAAIPATPLGIIAGALFGSLVGVALVSLSSTIAASIAFLLARYIAADSIEQWIQRRQGKLQRLYSLLETHGALVVAFTRLIPLFPFNLLNYAFGLTKVKFRTYVFWSWLCMLPGTIIVVVGTDVITQGLTQGRITWELVIILGVALAILIGLTWYVKQQLHVSKKEKNNRTLGNKEPHE